MKKIILFMTLFLSVSVSAGDSFANTKWNAFLDSTPVELSNNIIMNYDKDNRYVFSVEGFARSKYNKAEYYYLYVLDCSAHVISLWTQAAQPIHVRTEYINPSHPVWDYRNEVCRRKANGVK